MAFRRDCNDYKSYRYSTNHNRAQRVIEDLLLEIAKTYTLIMVSHNIDQALRIADSLAIMQVQEGGSQIIKVPKDREVLESHLNP